MLSTIRSTRGLQRVVLLAGLVLVAIFVLMALLAPLLAPYGFNDDRAGGVIFGTQLPPSGAHPFGTTVGGQDVLSRVIFGARTAAAVVVLGVILSSIIGVPLGLISGYQGGRLDKVLVLVMDALYTLPSLLLAIVVSIILGGGQSGALGGIAAAAISITVIFIPQYFRVVRNATLSVKVEPYVDAARVIGAGTPRILFKHVLSNVASTLPVIATLNASEAILTLAGLGFLGLGVEPSTAAEWGYDLNRALSDATNGIWWTGVFPGLAIVLMVLGVTMVGESLNDIANPLLRSRVRGKVTSDEDEVRAEFEAAYLPKRHRDQSLKPAISKEQLAQRRIATLSLADLAVSFDTDAGLVQAVNGVSFDLDPGEVVAVVGESGSGKTVSSRAVVGLLPTSAHTGGSAMLRGEELFGLTPRALRPIRGDKVASIFQEPASALNPVYTIGWQIIEGLLAHEHLPKKAARARAIELLGLVGMPDPERRVDFYPHQLSGGQKQRVVIAMAIACDPDVIIADEPTTALDVTVQAAILELLLELRDRLGTAIVLITHNMGVVAQMADRVVVMYRGNIVEEASATALFSKPKHPYTRHLLDAVPHLGTGVRKDRVKAKKSAPVLVSAEDLVVDFPGHFGRPSVRAVDHVGLEVRRGEVLGLVGESGSGKTTVGRCLVGLQTPTAGFVEIAGQRLAGSTGAEMRKLRASLGFVFQDPSVSLDPRQTVFDSISEPLLVHQGDSGKEQQQTKVRRMLERVQLPSGYASRYPHELSGGQRQRVSLARALILEPELLVADEPTSALDVSVQARILGLFEELQRELKFACVFISHDLAVVDSLANRVAVMRRGKIIEMGPRSQVLRHPKENYTKRLIASVPVPDPEEQRRRRLAHETVPADLS